MAARSAAATCSAWFDLNSTPDPFDFLIFWSTEIAPNVRSSGLFAFDLVISFVLFQRGLPPFPSFVLSSPLLGL